MTQSSCSRRVVATSVTRVQYKKRVRRRRQSQQRRRIIESRRSSRESVAAQTTSPPRPGHRGPLFRDLLQKQQRRLQATRCCECTSAVDVRACVRALQQGFTRRQRRMLHVTSSLDLLAAEPWPDSAPSSRRLGKADKGGSRAVVGSGHAGMDAWQRGTTNGSSSTACSAAQQVNKSSVIARLSAPRVDTAGRVTLLRTPCPA